jgi:hypothetical protein
MIARHAGRQGRGGTISTTGIRTLALANGHGRYITLTPERALASVAVGNGSYTHMTTIHFQPFQFMKRSHNGRFASETATWIQKWFKMFSRTSRKLWNDIIFFQGGDDGAWL